jgi:hypothetical protein
LRQSSLVQRRFPWPLPLGVLSLFYQIIKPYTHFGHEFIFYYLFCVSQCQICTFFTTVYTIWEQILLFLLLFFHFDFDHTMIAMPSIILNIIYLISNSSCMKAYKQIS